VSKELIALTRLKALTLLSECTGDDIWSVEHCRLRGVPEAWIEALVDCYESGFERESQTIFVRNSLVNQYHGLRDIDLAIKLGEFLGVDVETLNAASATRARLVLAILQAIEEE
jgi:prepilin signal peptidase PulO-like enzyme (type II secretory pathway)